MSSVIGSLFFKSASSFCKFKLLPTEEHHAERARVLYTRAHFLNGSGWLLSHSETYSENEENKQKVVMQRVTV
jgi:hypothetical protein